MRYKLRPRVTPTQPTVSGASEPSAVEATLSSQHPKGAQCEDSIQDSASADGIETCHPQFDNDNDNDNNNDNDNDHDHDHDHNDNDNDNDNDHDHDHDHNDHDHNDHDHNDHDHNDHDHNAKKRKRASDDTSDRTPINKRHDRIRTWCESSGHSYDSEEKDTTPMQELSNFLTTLEDELVKDEAKFETCEPEVKQALSGIKKMLHSYADRIPKVASDMACTQRQLNDVEKELSHLWESIKETNNNVLNATYARQNS